MITHQPLTATGWGPIVNPKFMPIIKDPYGKEEEMDKIEKWINSCVLRNSLSDQEEDICSVNNLDSDKNLGKVKNPEWRIPTTLSNTINTSELLSSTSLATNRFDDEISASSGSKLLRNFALNDNLHDLGELVDYSNSSSAVLAVLYNRRRLNDGRYELHTYSRKYGMQKLYLDENEFTEEINGTHLIKYIQIGVHYRVIPLSIGKSSIGLIDLKTFRRRSIEIRVYGLCNFVDFKQSSSKIINTIIWSDSIGKIVVTPRDREHLRRKFSLPVDDIFAPLRLFQVLVRADTLKFEKGKHPRWAVKNISIVSEEDENFKDLTLYRNIWPASVIRFDDLILTSRSQFGFYFWSPSRQVTVFAVYNLSSLIYSAGPKYAENGVMTAVAAPYYENSVFKYYEALLVGPFRILMLLTEERILNFKPKSVCPFVNKQWKCGFKKYMNSPYPRKYQLKPTERLDFRRED